MVEEFNGVQLHDMEGAGAAGGLGGGMAALLGAKLKRGIDMVLDVIQFDRMIEGSDLVITGEGRIDKQTIMGKAPSGVLAAATKQQIPTIAIGGCVVWCEELRNSGFAAIEAVTPEGMPLDEAMLPDVAKRNIAHTAERIAKRLQSIELEQ
jgi:glycerate kinase